MSQLGQLKSKIQYKQLAGSLVGWTRLDCKFIYVQGTIPSKLGNMNSLHKFNLEGTLVPGVVSKEVCNLAELNRILASSDLDCGDCSRCL
jgi:hypothetical protein